MGNKLEYSEQGQYTKFDLKAASNLCLFFEDRNKDLEYKIMLNPYLRRYIKGHIYYFGLGDKPQVIKMVRDNSLKYRANMVFVMDKDFDEFLDCLIDEDDVVYTRYYNIEAVLFESSVVSSLVALACPDIYSKLDFPKWKMEFICDVKDLFVSYILARKHNLANIPTSYEKAFPKICSNNYLDKEGIAKQIEEIQKLIPDYSKEKNEVEKFINDTYLGDYERIICGKILFACFEKYIKYSFSFPSQSSESQFNTIIATGMRTYQQDNPRFKQFIEDILNERSTRKFLV